MSFIRIQLLVLLAISGRLTLAQQAAEEAIEVDKLSVEFGVIPEVIQKPAGHELHIFYGSTKVDPGKYLSVSRVQLQFSSILIRLDSNETVDDDLFTLVMVDPDSPDGRQTKPDFLEQLHYLAINIPAQNMTSGSDTFEGFSLKKGNVLARYVSPNPTAQTGDHRYVFVLYKQNVKIDNPPPIGDRQQFNLSKWVAQQSSNITIIPFAVNFFLAKA